MQATTHTRKLTPPANEHDHMQGELNAAVVLLEYGDFECPHCAAAHPVVRAIQDRMQDHLCFAYRHFPLATVHLRATPAAEASEAADAQGEFWSMHDLLFESQDALEDEDLLAYAQSLGLDLGPFTRDLTEHKFLSRVKDNFT